MCRAKVKLGGSKLNCSRHTHTRTHPSNGPFSGTTRVSRYQKGETNLDFTAARDSDWQWHQLSHMSALAPDRQPRQHLSFYRPDALPATQPTEAKHRRRQKLFSAICNYFHIATAEQFN